MVKGVSGTVVALILLVIALAIIVMLIIYAGQTSKGGMLELIQQLNVIKRGG